MNKYLPYVGIPVSAAVAYLAVFFLQPAYAAVLVGIPLLFLGRKYSALSGFVIGLVVPFIMLLSYPVSEVVQLSGIVGQLTGMPGTLILVVYPLMYGVIGAISALLFTGIRELAFQERKEPSGECYLKTGGNLFLQTSYFPAQVKPVGQVYHEVHATRFPLVLNSERNSNPVNISPNL